MRTKRGSGTRSQEVVGVPSPESSDNEQSRAYEESTAESEELGAEGPPSKPDDVFENYPKN